MKKNKTNWIETFMKFWDDQAGNQFDYPSLDVYFKDGSTMKMFISPWYWSMMDLNIPKVVFTYEDRRYVIETPGFAPAANQNGKQVKSYFKDWVLYLYNKYHIDITDKEIDHIYENVLTK